MANSLVFPKPLASHSPSLAIPQFQKALCTWFKEVGKTYPWRETEDPYAILVSEIMLQQTQIATVLKKGYYVNWMEQFPNTQSLAKASEADVLKAWEGLGYYSRARNLQKMASIVETLHDGVFPQDYESILALPGVGRYTVGAVTSFAFNQPHPIVDGNIARVLSRIFDEPEPIDSTKGQKQLWQWSSELLDPINPRIFNSAFMELGQRICKKQNPLCHECPVAFTCLTTNPETLPKKKAKVKTIHRNEWVSLMLRSNQNKSDRAPQHEIFMTQIEGKQRTGLWGFPEFTGNTEQAEADYESTYAITKFKVSLFGVIESQPQDMKHKGQWIPFEELDSIAIAAPYRKLLNWLIKKVITETTA